MFDLLITGGQVVDGTGNPWFKADVGVKQGRITIIRGCPGLISAKRVIQAAGSIVCPGFIDMHAHSGLGTQEKLSYDVTLTDGVTTELVGLDGISYAPLPDSGHVIALDNMSGGLNGTCPAQVTWKSVSEYLNVLNTKSSTNKGMIVGNAALRLSILGWETRAPTSFELSHMKELLCQSMHEGALGLSSGLSFPPSRYAIWRELVELCRLVRERGGLYITHLRADRWSTPRAALREAIAIGASTGVAIHISHLHVGISEQASSFLEIIDTARARDIDVTFDISDYPHTNGPLAALLPDWILDKGPFEIIKRLKNRHYRERLFSDPVLRHRDFSRILVTGFARPAHRGLEGASLAAIAHAFGKSEMETLCYLLAGEELRLRYVGLRESDFFSELIQHPACVVSTGGAPSKPQSAHGRVGSNSRILGRISRERTSINLAEVIRKMTSFPAQRLGFTERGLIRNGYQADLVVVDLGKARALIPTPLCPEAFSGVQYVVIGGKLVVDQGQVSDVEAGSVIYGRGNHIGRAEQERDTSLSLS